MVWGLTP